MEVPMADRLPIAKEVFERLECLSALEGKLGTMFLGCSSVGKCEREYQALEAERLAGLGSYTSVLKNQEGRAEHHLEAGGGERVFRGSEAGGEAGLGLGEGGRQGRRGTRLRLAKRKRGNRTMRRSAWIATGCWPRSGQGRTTGTKRWKT